jgi:streptomycin 6-kinase
MEDIHKTLTDMGDTGGALFYLDEALRIYDELKLTYTRKCLLHGDLHHENMLLNAVGGYTVIDPKGVVDDPVMETARYLLNECDGNEKKIREIVGIMSPLINVPEADILKGMFIDAALIRCWCWEENYEIEDEVENNKLEALEDMGFVYGMLQ